MILADEREKFKSKIGSHYIAVVSGKLQERGILGRKNKPYGKTFISMVVHGDRENAAIEDVVRGILLGSEEIQETKKPEAVTPGSAHI
ncbi:hypothetical protein ACLI09_08640 [Flavobacterium sp. RHBU_24]|uniref:hypothetical protein n=1 Tax=Flavobacterium sp. RHBU_24 TaxID=3391185 RepID=UPI0039856273